MLDQTKNKGNLMQEWKAPFKIFYVPFSTHRSNRTQSAIDRSGTGTRTDWVRTVRKENERYKELKLTWKKQD